MDQWQDIETAPKDKERVLLWAGGLAMIGRWAERFSAEHYGDASPGWYAESLDRRVSPTHWMPLPALPRSRDDD